MSRPLGDEDLLRAAGQAVRSLGRVPGSVGEAGRAAFAHRPGAGARLAAVVYDSLLDDHACLRAPTGPREVTFQAESLTVDVAIDEDRLVGQIVPGAPAEVALLTVDGVAGQTTADELGCFVLAPPPAGPAKFRCRMDGTEVVTEWLRL